MPIFLLYSHCFSRLHRIWDALFCPHFFHGRLDYVPPTPVPEALLSCSHQRSAIPSQFPLTHPIFPNPIPISFQRNLPLAILENTGEYCCRTHILVELLSIGTQSAEHKRCPPAPVGPADLGVLARALSDNVFLDLAVSSECTLLLLPTVHPILSRTAMPFSLPFPHPWTFYHTLVNLWISSKVKPGSGRLAIPEHEPELG